MEFSRQEYWNGLIFPTLGALPDPRIKTASQWFSVKNPPAIKRDPRDQTCITRKEALEEAVASHPRILTWDIPWTKESDRLLSMGLQKVGHNFTTEHAQGSK